MSNCKPFHENTDVLYIATYVYNIPLLQPHSKKYFMIHEGGAFCGNMGCIPPITWLPVYN